jgi:hypothetical protein
MRYDNIPGNTKAVLSCKFDEFDISLRSIFSTHIPRDPYSETLSSHESVSASFLCRDSDARTLLDIQDSYSKISSPKLKFELKTLQHTFLNGIITKVENDYSSSYDCNQLFTIVFDSFTEEFQDSCEPCCA